METPREQWRQELANLNIELGLAGAFLREAEQGFDPDQLVRAREQVASLKDAINGHRCMPQWYQLKAQLADRESKSTRTETGAWRSPTRTRDHFASRDRL